MNKNNKISNGTRRGIIFGLLVIFLLLTFTKTSHALIGFNFGKQFGGRIVNTEAKEITALEARGYDCVVPGYTFSIIPIGLRYSAPTSYFVPFSTTSKTKNSLQTDQLIIGRYKYDLKEMIACTSKTNPPTITIVPLDTVNLFGNSR